MKGQTIILLDDDAELRNYLAAVLEGDGYQVVCAANSQDLTKLVLQHQAALLITDLVMPEHEGMEGIFQVLQQHRIPIIAMSSYAQYLEVVESVVSRTLLKPLQAEQLLQEVYDVLEG